MAGHWVAYDFILTRKWRGMPNVATYAGSEQTTLLELDEEWTFALHEEHDKDFLLSSTTLLSVHRAGSTLDNPNKEPTSITLHIHTPIDSPLRTDR